MNASTEKKTHWLMQLALVAVAVGGGLLAGYGGTDLIQAQLISEVDAPEGVVSNPDFRGVIVTFINYFLTFVGLIAVAFIIWAGVLMIIDGGDEESVGKAKKILIWAAVGLLLVMLSFAIVNFVIRAGSAAG